MGPIGFLIFAAVAWPGSKVAQVADEMTAIWKLMEKDRAGIWEAELPVFADDKIET